MNIFDFRDQLLKEQKLLEKRKDKIRAKYNAKIEEINDMIDKKVEEREELGGKIYNYTKLDVVEFGTKISNMMTEIEGEEYVFHKAKVISITHCFDYGKYDTEYDYATVYMISPKSSLKNSYEVEYYPEYQRNPIFESHIILGYKQIFGFYDYDFKRRYFDKYTYIKEFIDEIILMKDAIQTGTFSGNEKERLNEIYESVISKYKKDKVKVK